MSLTWKTTRPLAAGWFWIRTKDGRESIVSPTCTYNSKDVVAWAGPIARPKQPSQAQLAMVRYKLDGAYLAPRTGGWGQYEWDIVARSEMLRRARLHLCGGEDCRGQPWPADSEWVTLFTSVKRGGRWNRQRGERFTVANIDAAIEKCAPAAMEAVA